MYGVPDRLKDYATSKKDISNGVEVNPKEEYRLRKEDQYEETSFTQGNQSTASTNNYDDEISQWNNEVKNSVSTNMYSRNEDKNVGLKDFIIKSVIGRGSFGKVFLV